jgi:putative endonuclease
MVENGSYLHQASTVVCRQILDSHLTPAQLGRLGEHFASDMLARNGWRILARNYHTRYGEIDIISRDLNGQLVFTEVKTRRSCRFGTPEEAVGPTKQRHLRLASYQWLHDNRQHRPGQPLNSHRPPSPRFDVIAVIVNSGHIRARLIKGAF